MIILNNPRLGEFQVEEGEQGARHRPRALRPRGVLPVGQVQGMYSEVQLNLTPEIEVFYMLFDISLSISLKQHI